MIAIRKQKHISGHSYAVGEVDDIGHALVFVRTINAQFHNLKEARMAAKGYAMGQPVDRQLWEEDYSAPAISRVKPIA